MKKQFRTKRILLCITVVVFAVLLIWMLWENTALELNTYTISGEKLPDSFDGFRIAHVSDLHNAQIGEDNETLLLMLAEAEPDIITITGDMIDTYRTDVDVALKFAREAVKIAPCYYITGNHEARISQYPVLKEGLLQLGVTVMEDTSVEIWRSGESITIAGLDDPSFQTGYQLGDFKEVMENKLRGLVIGENSYTVLLSHRPELFEIYAASGADLVLSGHAHGGQFRLPFIGGLYAPGQGLFPQYDAGLFTQEDTNMIVSRGIGNSLFPLRFNNPPEVVLIQLRQD